MRRKTKNLCACGGTLPSFPELCIACERSQLCVVCAIKMDGAVCLICRAGSHPKLLNCVKCGKPGANMCNSCSLLHCSKCACGGTCPICNKQMIHQGHKRQACNECYDRAKYTCKAHNGLIPNNLITCSDSFCFSFGCTKCFLDSDGQAFCYKHVVNVPCQLCCKSWIPKVDVKRIVLYKSVRVFCCAACFTCIKRVCVALCAKLGKDVTQKIIKLCIT